MTEELRAPSGGKPYVTLAYEKTMMCCVFIGPKMYCYLKLKGDQEPEFTMMGSISKRRGTGRLIGAAYEGLSWLMMMPRAALSDAHLHDAVLRVLHRMVTALGHLDVDEVTKSAQLKSRASYGKTRPAHVVAAIRMCERDGASWPIDERMRYVTQFPTTAKTKRQKLDDGSHRFVLDAKKTTLAVDVEHFKRVTALRAKRSAEAEPLTDEERRVLDKDGSMQLFLSDLLRPEPFCKLAQFAVPSLADRYVLVATALDGVQSQGWSVSERVDAPPPPLEQLDFDQVDAELRHEAELGGEAAAATERFYEGFPKYRAWVRERRAHGVAVQRWLSSPFEERSEAARGFLPSLEVRPRPSRPLATDASGSNGNIRDIFERLAASSES